MNGLFNEPKKMKAGENLNKAYTLGNMDPIKIPNWSSGSNIPQMLEINESKPKIERVSSKV